jgi:hypothetical protein
MVGIVVQLENAQPSVARLLTGGEQLEYPWLSLTGDVCWPSAHFSLGMAIFHPKSREASWLFHFAWTMLDAFFDLFGKKN